MSQQPHAVNYAPQGDTMKRFHESDARFRCLLGPLGSGKTTGTIVELHNMMQTHKAVDGVRKS